MIRRLSLIGIALTVGTLSLAPSASAAGDVELIIGHKAGTSAAERADTRADAGVQHRSGHRLKGVEIVRVPSARKDAALTELQHDPDVLWAQENHEMRQFAAAPTDAFFRFQWYLQNTGSYPSNEYGLTFSGTPGSDMNALSAWDFSTGAGVTVAVVDSGALLTHGDLVNQFTPARYDFVENDADPTATTNDHGTHVAGTIAAQYQNPYGTAPALGTVGLAYNAKIMPVRVLNDEGTGNNAQTASGFDFAGASGARIVNASLGSVGTAPVLDAVFNKYPNTLFVVAAGNGGEDSVGDNNDTTPVAPCNSPSPNVLCVGATNGSDQMAQFSNYGDASVDVFAPGERIVAPVIDNSGNGSTATYDFKDGTSMASPLVAAEAALLLAKAPTLTAAQLKALIMTNVDKPAGLAPFSVSDGRADAGMALAALHAQQNPPVKGCPDGSTIPVAAACPAPPPPPAPLAASVKRLSATSARCKKRKGCAKRTVTLRFALANATNADVLVQRRTCKTKRVKKGKKSRKVRTCTWKRSSSSTVPGTAGLVKKTLKAGTYRFRVTSRGPGGQAASPWKTVTVKRK